MHVCYPTLLLRGSLSAWHDELLHKRTHSQPMLQNQRCAWLCSAVLTSGVNTDKGTMVQKKPRDTQ